MPEIDTTKRTTEIPTIDVNIVSVQTYDSTTEYILDTASQIGLAPEVDTTDAVKLVIKGVLKAQKPAVTTITGNTITLTDNVFTPELVQILQGGQIEYEEDGTTVKSYTPPVAGSTEKGKPFILRAYSAQYSASGEIVRYECIEYPHCKGTPVALSSEDNVFRVNTYTINSAPDQGEAPYKITYVNQLPTPTVTL